MNNLKINFKPGDKIKFKSEKKRDTPSKLVMNGF